MISLAGFLCAPAGGSARAVHARHGFSLIELMITTVIAGVVFAAMTPLFLGAQTASSLETVRNEATNLAQDRIEKIRALNYSDIVADAQHLNSSTFHGGQFGTLASVPVGGGTRVFAVAYTVSEVSTGMKRVSVTVSWTAPPGPVKPVTMTTYISKQYAGPQVTSLDWTPKDAAGDVTGSPVDLTATIASSDVSSTTKVIFYVFSVEDGTQVASAAVNTGDAGNTSAGTYAWSWDPGGAADGDYSFRAQAYSNDDPGNTYRCDVSCVFTGGPPKVAGLVTTPGDGRVELAWNACTASDFDHYEVWAGSASGAESQVTIDPPLTATSYIVTGLTNDDTYYFKVYAVDTDGTRGPASDEVCQTPTSMPDVNRPSEPGSFAAAASANTAVLTWTAATQDATSTLAGYYIYRDSGASPYAAVGAAAVSFTDTIGWGTTHTYQVRAYNTAGRQSVRTDLLTVTTGTAPTYNLVVTNTNKSSSITVYVQSTSTGLWWTGNANPSQAQAAEVGISIAKKNKKGTWYALPYDTYQVTTSGGSSQTVTMSSAQAISFGS